MRWDSNPVWLGRRESDNHRRSAVSAPTPASAASAITPTNQGDVAKSEEAPDELPRGEWAMDTDDELARDDLDGHAVMKDEVMTAMEPTPTIELSALEGLGPFPDAADGRTSSWEDGDFPTAESVRNDEDATQDDFRHVERKRGRT